jgi:transposase
MGGKEGGMRIIALDIHRVFAEAVALEDGEYRRLEDGEYRRLGRIGMTRDHLLAFAATLRPTDHVVVEATGNATAVVEVLAPKVARVAVANPFQVHLIARAKTKTDKIDARVLARLYAAGFLPEVWIPDERTLARRRQVTRRNQLVKSRVRLKAIVQSILHAHLAPRCPHADLFGGKGRAWLRAQILPQDEQAAIERHLEDHDRQTTAQKQVERDIAEAALNDQDVRRLMTIPGIDMVVAVGVMAAIGRIDRFASPDHLAAYLGLNPSVRHSGDGPAYHGRITKRGRSDARHLLVEAAWQTARSPGPMRAFYERVRARRGNHVAAVAVARKLAVLIWHMLRKGEDYAWGRPVLMARKLRSLELAAGRPAQRGQRGSAYDYNLPDRRAAEQAMAEQAEHTYRRIMQHWRQRKRQQGAGAANEARH